MMYYLQAKYTEVLANLIESNFDLGLRDYPCYTEEIRERLNKKIKEHFYFREIGLETPEYFKRRLNHKMNMIMPYYNQLYKSEDLEYNPLYNIELTETYEHNSTTDGSSNMTGDNKQTSTANDKINTKNNSNSNNVIDNHEEKVAVNSDTPKSSVTMDEIKNNKYASKTDYEHNDIKSGDTTTQDSTGETTSSQNATGESTTKNDMTTKQNVVDSYIRRTEGSSAGLSFSKAIEQWRKVMLNIDAQVIDELEDLFMGIW